jgi:hypothetical protein
VRDAELFASVGLWIVACGLAAALLARLVLRRRAA